MGKQAKRQQAQAQAEAEAFQHRFAAHRERQRTRPAPPPLEEVLGPFRAVCLQAPSTFVLRLKSQDRRRQALALVRHCLARYRVPPILDQAWHTDALAVRSLRGEGAHPSRGGVDFRAWYACVGAGGSLFKTHTKALGLTKADTHAFLGAPADLSLIRAVAYGVALGAGGTVGSARRVAQSKLGEVFPGEVALSMIRFLAQPIMASLTVPQINDLLDFLWAQQAEGTPLRLFGMGHTPASLNKRVQDWHWALRRIRLMGQASWAGVPLPNTALEGQINGHSVVWHFTQITTAKALVAEGNAMHHCVAVYKDRCVAGRLSIWSLCVETFLGERKRKVTLEVRDDGRIVQMRGFGNRLPRSEERHAIARWAHQHRLTLVSE